MVYPLLTSGSMLLLLAKEEVPNATTIVFRSWLWIDCMIVYLLFLFFTDKNHNHCLSVLKQPLPRICKDNLRKGMLAQRKLP